MTAEQNCPDIARFEELLAGNVPDEEQEELGKHIEQCDDCRRRLEEMAGDVSVVSDNGGDTGQNADDTPQLDGAIEKLLTEGPDQTLTSVCTESSERDFSLDFLDPTDHPDHLGRLGPYEIAGVIGRGGMGVVLRGMDPRLDRYVAIKVLHPHLLSDGVARKRFLGEAKAAAAITHDHVVTIHAVDEVKGMPFLVMEYVVGVSLDERIKRDGTLTLEEILRIGMQTASGLSAAHAQGLVHRDIKPSNVLLENGVERVKITDFGLARIVHDAQITQSNVVAGTPEYMSPEQAQGDPLDHRSDLFSLGCLLYAMCTGRSPFRGSSSIRVIRRVCEDTPRPIQEVNRDIPDWLVNIVDRLLAKKADDRFQSASEVAELLGSHLAHLQRPAEVPLPQPSRLAVPHETRTADGRRWRVAALAACALLLLLGVWAVVALRNGNASREPVRATSRRGNDDDAGAEPKRTNGPPPEENGTLIVADHEKDVWPRVKVIIGLPDGHTMPVPKEGQRIPLPPGVYRVDVCRSDNDLLLRRGWVKLIPGSKVFVELRMGYGLVPVPLSQRRPEAELLGHANEITCAVFSADGEMVATASWDKTVKLWKRNGSEWREGLTLEGHTGRVRCVAFAPDGSVVATASEDGTVKLWSVATGQETATLTEHVGEVCAVAFSPDGAILASAGEDRSIRLWDWKQRQLVKTLRGHAEHVLCIAFSPDGESLASGAGDRTIKLWSITAGQERYTLSGHTRKVMSLAFAPDGATLASESEDAMVMLWDTVSGRIVRTLGVRGHAGGADAVAGVAFSPDGKVLATGGPYVVKLWDPSTGALYDEFHAHWKRIRSVRFSPSGNMLLTGSRDFTARLWRVPTEMRVKRKSPHPIASFPYGFAPFVAFHPHELRFAVPQHHGGGLEIWHTEGSGTQPVLLQETVEGLGKRGAVGSSAAFLPDGKTVITCGSDNCWRIWDSETCRLLETIENDLPLRRLAVAPDGKTIAAIQTSEGLPSWRRECKTAKVWNVESKEAIRTLHSPRGRITRVAFSPDSKLIAACTHLGGVILFDAETGKEVDVLVEYGFTPASGPLPSAALESMIYCLAFSPDGGTLACQKDLSTVQLWDVAQRKPIGTFSHDATDIVMSVAFSPDGRILATAGGNYDLIGSQEMSTLPKVKLWDASTGGLLAEFAGHIAPVARVSFSRDGTILATCGTADAKLNLWRVAELLQAGATPKEESPPSDTEDKSPE